MSIQILPARLANQIAAGEVVERPASVVKELVENSLDAGATKISIDIEKGGAKKIRINDNGSGIVKDELTLALSRHATSKIKDLHDLEAISSLGFRGEALASISSVARLTLTSKTAEQGSAWQAYAQGRDMEVTIQPAAHPNGTTIEVNDLFFNTPARRKFLRTEKTEFGHIDEVVRRIALARFDVSFTLTHNGKVIKQYRAAKESSQYAKRVAQVCGQKFIEHSIVVDCEHDGLHLWGWIGKPDYYRSQNDLCYSYVNGRMMRDKLINHGIRQAFSDLMPNDAYPAFVLFLDLDHKEVDVNVHPAKHEVRFHQGRYVHDFIFTVCNRAIQAEFDAISQLSAQPEVQDTSAAAGETFNGDTHFQLNSSSQQSQQPSAYTNRADTTNSVEFQPREYVRPLQASSQVNEARQHSQYQANNMVQAADAYQELMSTPALKSTENNSAKAEAINVLDVVEQQFAVVMYQGKLKLLNLKPLAQQVNLLLIKQRWEQGLVSQPLLLPTLVSLDKNHVSWINTHINILEHAGIVVQVQSGNKVQIRQFPALLREQDVSQSFSEIIDKAFVDTENNHTAADALINAVAETVSNKEYPLLAAKQLILQAESLFSDKLNDIYHLNSCDIDLTSAISQLK